MRSASYAQIDPNNEVLVKTENTQIFFTFNYNYLTVLTALNLSLQ